MTTENPYNISIFGLGYVGCVSAACLARDGHQVTGVDVSEVKVDAIKSGSSPIEEPGLNDLIKTTVSQGKLSATTDIEYALNNSSVSLICVGTPSSPNGSLNHDYVERVCEQIGNLLKNKAPGHIIVIRSTMLPGSMAKVVRPALERSSGQKEGEHFHIAFNPEFLRESTAISDYDNPPKIVIGTNSESAAKALTDIYGHLDAPLIVTAAEVAEMVKYADNNWHAVKIAFGNEIGEVCRAANIDSHAVMDIFLQDRQLNISEYYLRPGFAFGGSCLPKDLRALTYFGRQNDLELPLLNSTLASNKACIESLVNRILSTGAKKVGMYGLSFKRNTDDLRESPYVIVAEQLLGKGIQLRIYDENIQITRLTGANKEYIDTHIPHLINYTVDGFNAFNDFAELVVMGHKSNEAADWASGRNKSIKIFDLARLPNAEVLENYEGISW